MRLVPINQITNDMVLAQDIFANHDSVSPIIRQGANLNQDIVEKLEQHGIMVVFVQDLQEAPITPIVNQGPLSHSVAKIAPAINEELKDKALDNLQDIFEFVSISGEDVHTSSAQLVTQLDSIVEGLVGALVNDQSVLVNISDLKSYDDYTYHHSLSVAVLAISIGQVLNFSESELNQLGMCAMMHDIGKTAIPIEIIQKPSRLNESEFSLIQTHSSAGVDYLTKTKIGDEKIWSGVMYHHEKYDGTGYPNGLKAEEIPLWSRIISVADVYDALTSSRPYRAPMEPAHAIEYIMGGAGSSFDFDVVHALIRKIDLYPIGTCVELSDGTFAVVLDNENQLRPVVQLLHTQDIVDLYYDRRFLSVVIKRTVPDDEIIITF